MTSDEVILKERLHNYLDVYVKNAKLTAPKFHITNGANQGDNYVGLVYRVTIESSGKNGETKKGQFIVKTTRLTTFASGKVPEVTDLFQRETFFYQEILPTFRETLKGHRGIVERFAAFYDAHGDIGKEILMLEDLSPQGFRMSSSKVMDYSHAGLALRCLGELHAYSFIMRVANPKSFERFKRLKEPLLNEKLYGDNTARSQELAGIAIKALADEEEYYAERIRRFSDEIEGNMCSAVDGTLAEPYAVVNHGDAWTNNILFKYDQDGKTPCDLRFIDFQLCRYASPVLDLVYILFCCCTQETRRKYYDQLIREYYETLSRYIKSCGYDPDSLFPYEALMQQFAKFGKYAAGMAIYVLHLFYTDNDGIDLNNINVIEEKLQTNKFYRSMIKGTFKDLVDKNYI